MSKRRKVDFTKADAAVDRLIDEDVMAVKSMVYLLKRRLKKIKQHVKHVDKEYGKLIGSKKADDFSNSDYGGTVFSLMFAVDVLDSDVKDIMSIASKVKVKKALRRWYKEDTKHGQRRTVHQSRS